MAEMENAHRLSLSKPARKASLGGLEYGREDNIKMNLEETDCTAELIQVESSVFLDITPRNPVKIKRRFERTYNLHLQRRKVNHARNQHEVSRMQSRQQTCLTIRS
jgi:hypothetical protein